MTESLNPITALKFDIRCDKCGQSIRQHQHVSEDVVERVAKAIFPLDCAFENASEACQSVWRDYARAAIAEINMGAAPLEISDGEPTAAVAASASLGEGLVDDKGLVATSPTKTPWTCPDCCVNPCGCKLMGDASTRKDEGADDARNSSPANVDAVSISANNVDKVGENVHMDEILPDVVDEYLHWRKVNPHIKGGENYLKRLRAATRKPVSDGEISDVDEKVLMKQIMDICDNTEGYALTSVLLRDLLRPYLATRKPVSVSLEKCVEDIAHIGEHDTKPDIAKSVIESLRSQGMEIVCGD